ncbi:unnamed protein product [Schistosoma curassoni]|uniref:Uncharacterized protein n=1 Tax=Schistosoma curassoni TaxID=6186 RepID=A0A183K020_9TREM|nr:unnamed protein product [Schistosoma curassoni]
MDKPTITNISNPNQNYTNNDTVHQSLVNGFSSPTHNIQDDYTTNNTTTTNNNNTCSSSSLHEQQLNNSYDFCTLPRSRNRDYQIKGGNHYNEMKNDELLSTTMNQLQTDLMNSRFNEADTKKILHELRCKLHELEESKSDQSLRSAEQIAVLKDELFGAKLRETELINQVEELKRRFDDLNSLWQPWGLHVRACLVTQLGAIPNAHIGKCKGVNNDTKRSSLWIGSLNSLDSHETNFKMKFSDRLLETRFVNQISSLKQQITDLTVQQELSDRRADRLDKRVTELLESRTAFQTRERELTLELKQLEQKCADIEAKI